MKTYARMINGAIAQIIPALFDASGNEVPLEARFPAEMVEQLVEYDPLQRPKPPEPTIPELIERAKAETRIQRQPIIDVLTGMQASALTIGDMPKAQLIETAKQSLLDLTSTDLSGCTTYDEMRAVIKAAYLAMVMAAPSLKLAFAEALR